MGATSIHVQAVKPGSEIHNFREKELDYVRPELSHLNESWVGDSISHRLESAKQRYLDTVGQKMQAKAAPIREGVIVIKQETTMQELQQFATVCKERFGIEAFQIHIHKDEGYMNAKQWTPNLHAHVVFDWTQPNGKSVRLSRDDMAELQTIASETLGMERGVSSDRKHLSAMQYKTECAKEQLQELSNDISSALDKHKDVQNQLLQLQKELRSIETKKNVQKLISKASEKFAAAMHRQAGIYRTDDAFHIESGRTDSILFAHFSPSFVAPSNEPSGMGMIISSRGRDGSMGLQAWGVIFFVVFTETIGSHSPM